VEGSGRGHTWIVHGRKNNFFKGTERKNICSFPKALNAKITFQWHCAFARSPAAFGHFTSDLGFALRFTTRKHRVDIS